MEYGDGRSCEIELSDQDVNLSQLTSEDIFQPTQTCITIMPVWLTPLFLTSSTGQDIPQFTTLITLALIAVLFATFTVTWCVQRVVTNRKSVTTDCGIIPIPQFKMRSKRKEFLHRKKDTNNSELTTVVQSNIRAIVNSQQCARKLPEKCYSELGHLNSVKTTTQPFTENCIDLIMKQPKLAELSSGDCSDDIPDSDTIPEYNFPQVIEELSQRLTNNTMNNNKTSPGNSILKNQPCTTVTSCAGNEWEITSRTVWDNMMIGGPVIIDEKGKVHPSVHEIVPDPTKHHIPRFTSADANIDGDDSHYPSEEQSRSTKTDAENDELTNLSNTGQSDFQSSADGSFSPKLTAYTIGSDFPSNLNSSNCSSSGQSQTLHLGLNNLKSPFISRNSRPEVLLVGLDEQSFENIDDYKPGGYHPVLLGDVYNNRYRVLQKLGWGQFSTVWLCEDSRSMDFVALKIMRSARQYVETALDEIKILKWIHQKDPENRRVVQLLDSFTIDGVNGKHNCLVFEVLGKNVLALIVDTLFQGLPLSKVKRIVRQLLEALSFLHSKCNIIHTDIKPENVLICVNSVTKNSNSDKTVKHPTNFTNTIIEGDFCDLPATNTDSEKIKTSESPGKSFYDHFSKCPTNEIEVKLADLGNACFVNRHVDEKIQTRHYRALEVLIKAGYGPPADIWSVACLAFEMATGEFLFDPRAGESHSTTDDHLCQIIDLLGPIPQPVISKGEKSSRFFNELGEIKNIPKSKMKPWSLEEVLMEKYAWDKTEATDFASFLKGLLQFNPEERPTASQCLNHYWLQ